MVTLGQQLKHSVEPYFYALSSRPPAVVEFDMSDFENVNVRKIFYVEDPGDRFVGTTSVSINKNYILHLLHNPDTG